MKQQVLILIVCVVAVESSAQDASVEKSIFGIQTGFFGIWIHNETKIADPLAFRTEVGFDTGLWGGSYYDGVGFLLTPVITIEPRWYYNLNKRNRKNKRIGYNSGNFFSLKSSYHPDWFVISNQDDIRVISDISFVPTWGIRRSIGNNFNYEAGIGIGYRYLFTKNAGFSENEGEVALNLVVRFGYRFK